MTVNDKRDDLDIGRLIRPIPAAGIFRIEGYYCWGPQIAGRVDGHWWLVYSRWPRSSGEWGWLTHSEIALASARELTGPYTHHSVILTGRGPGHWDELMAHNPKLKCFDGKWYLYYISSRQGPTRGHVRDSQRTGVAVADDLRGPYRRFDAPLVEPSPPIHNIAVNPGVTRLPDGRFLLIIKGDITPKTPEEPMPQRVQAIGLADTPTGPFELLPDPAIADLDTEDASIWYDPGRDLCYAVFHAHTWIGLIVSSDGIHWHPAAHERVTGKRLSLADGTSLATDRLERPSVYHEEGIPRLLCLAAATADDWNCLLVPLADGCLPSGGGRDASALNAG